MPGYFEITVTSRQMVAAVVGVVALILVAFGIGLIVGGRGGPVPEDAGAGLVAVAPEPALHAVTAVPTEPSPAGTGGPATGSSATSPAAPTGEGPLPTSAPPEATVPPAAAPTSVPAARPTAAPTHAPATSRPAGGVRGGGEWVQVGALAQASAAERVRRRVLELGYTPAQVVVERGEDGKYRIRVGPLPDVESAQRVAARLRTNGFAGAFVVRP